MEYDTKRKLIYLLIRSVKTRIWAVVYDSKLNHSFES